MNQEELKYHKALQGVYKEKMGEWQWYDRWYDPEDGVDGVVLPGQLTEFRRGDFQEFIRLPLPIDPYDEGRGLLEMIKDVYNITKLDREEEMYIIGFWRGSDYDIADAPTPALALLKALASQEGVEV